MSISNPQQQSQITQVKTITPQVVRPMTQASQPIRVASKSNAHILYQGSSRVLQDGGLTSSQKLLPQGATTTTGTLMRNVSDHQIMVGQVRQQQQQQQTIIPSQGSSQVRHQQQPSQPVSTSSTVKIYSGGLQKPTQQTTPQKSSPTVLTQSIKTS